MGYVYTYLTGVEVTVNQHKRIFLGHLGRCIALDVHVTREMAAESRRQDVEGLCLVGHAVQAQGGPGILLGRTRHSSRALLSLGLSLRLRLRLRLSLRLARHSWERRSETGLRIRRDIVVRLPLAGHGGRSISVLVK
jgi:hypothetical protein